MQAIFRHTLFSTAAFCAAGSVFFLLLPQMARAQAGGLVISQIYAGGGLAGATYNRDFVELFNGTGSSISLANYTLQYAAATGVFQTTNSQVTTLSGNIASGSFFLIGLSPMNPSSGTALPVTPNISGAANLSTTGGKVALANNSTLVTFSGAAGSNTFSSNVVDFVGYGAADAYDGSAPAPTSTNTTSIVRNAFTATGAANASNFQDSNSNGADFTATASGQFAPRNSGSANPFGANFVPTETPEPGALHLVAAALPVAGGFRMRGSYRRRNNSQL